MVAPDYEPLVVQAEIPAELQKQVAWLAAHGTAVKPAYGFELAGAGASTATITTITWRDGAKFHHVEVPPFGASDDSVTVALVELVSKGLSTGPIEHYVPAVPAVPSPKPIDDVVGIPDPVRPGQWQPGPKANMAAWPTNAIYKAADGKYYKPKLIVSGPMPAWNWILA